MLPPYLIEASSLFQYTYSCMCVQEFINQINNQITTTMTKYNYTKTIDKTISFIGFISRVLFIFFFIVAFVFMLSRIRNAAVAYNNKTTQNER